MRLRTRFSADVTGERAKQREGGGGVSGLQTLHLRGGRRRTRNSSHSQSLSKSEASMSHRKEILSLKQRKSQRNHRASSHCYQVGLRLVSEQQLLFPGPLILKIIPVQHHIESAQPPSYSRNDEHSPSSDYSSLLHARIPLTTPSLSGSIQFAV